MFWNGWLIRILPYQGQSRQILPFCATGKPAHPQKSNHFHPNSLKLKQGIKAYDAGIAYLFLHIKISISLILYTIGIFN